jgi:ADP-heptose:LPS heptosyltransferase
LVQIKVPNKLYVRLYAGMGDFYKRYFCHPTWQCIEDLKTKHPEVNIRALLVSQTIPALELVDYHPYIGKIIKPRIHLKDFKNKEIKDYVEDHVFLSPGLAKNFQLRIPPIYLSKEDINFVNDITTKHDKYICIHPFAGDVYGLDTRMPLKVEEYIPMIKALIKKGYKVIMLVQEGFNWSHNGFTSLIDKTNARTAAALVKKSSGFIGTASSLMCAAWSMTGIKTTIITPIRWKKPLLDMVWAKERIEDPNHMMLYLNHDRSTKKLKDIADDTANWF